MFRKYPEMLMSQMYPEYPESDMFMIVKISIVYHNYIYSFKYLYLFLITGAS